MKHRLTGMQFALAALMVTLSAISYFDRTALSIAAPAVMKEFGFSEVAMGTVFSAFLLSYTLFMSPGGGAVDRFGARIVLTIAGFGAALFTGLLSLCSTIASFAGVRLVFGAFTAPIYTACARVTSARFPVTAQAGVQAAIIGGSALGAAFSPIVFAKLMTAVGWRAAFWVAALITAALIAVWYASIRDAPRPASQQTRSTPWRLLLTDVNMQRLTVSYFLVNYFEYIFFYWMYYYFVEIRKLGADRSAFAATILFLTMAVMTPLGGWLSDRLSAAYGLRFGRRAVAMTGMTLSAIFLYLGTAGYNVPATIALLSLALGCCACCEGPFWATAIHIGGAEVGATSGIMNTGGNLGGMFAPFFTPLIASRYGWTAALLFGCAMVLLSVVTFYLVDPGKRIVITPATATARSSV